MTSDSQTNILHFFVIKPAITKEGKFVISSINFTQSAQHNEANIYMCASFYATIYKHDVNNRKTYPMRYALCTKCINLMVDRNSTQNRYLHIWHCTTHLSFIDIPVPHVANGQFSAVRHRQHVHIQYGAPLFHISVQQRASEEEAGIVDADVDAAKLFTDAVEERLDLFWLVQVAVEGHQGAGVVRQLRRELLWDIRSRKGQIIFDTVQSRNIESGVRIGNCGLWFEPKGKWNKLWPLTIHYKRENQINNCVMNVII